MLRRMKALIWGLNLSIACLSLLAACKTEEKLPALGTNITGPVDVAAAPGSRYFYVLNSDFERRFNAGSILVIDSQAAEGSQKVRAIPTPRMGRSLAVAQNLLLVTYDALRSGEPRPVQLYSLADPSSPALLAEWQIACSPINGVIAANNPYFAVSCLSGELYIGTTDPNADGLVTLELVRSYGYPHRAMHFYENGDQVVLLGFPTDVDTPDSEDLASRDAKAYDPTKDDLIDGTDHIPDVLQDSQAARRRISTGFPYQMFVYNVKEEERQTAANPPANPASRFRYLELGPFVQPTQANKELRFVSYVVKEQDGSPSNLEGNVDLEGRIYRTNFWTTQPSLSGLATEFYLSQRGNSYGSSSNNVLRLRVNPSAIVRENAPFSEIFQVERVYGFSQDRDNIARYPSAFAVTEQDGEPMLIINHFRDLIHFKDAPFYSLTRKFLAKPAADFASESYDSTDFKSSFYQVAVNDAGLALTCSFYGNALYLFDVRPRSKLKSQTPLRIE